MPSDYMDFAPGDHVRSTFNTGRPYRGVITSLKPFRGKTYYQVRCSTGETYLFKASELTMDWSRRK